MKSVFLVIISFFILSLPKLGLCKGKERSKESSHGNLIILEGNLLKALKNDNVLKEAQMLPEQKPLQNYCFRVVNIQKMSRLNDLKIRKDDCISSIISYKNTPDGKSLSKDKLFLNSPQEMLKVIPFLTDSSRVEVDLLRQGRPIHLIYLIKEGKGKWSTKIVK